MAHAAPDLVDQVGQGHTQIGLHDAGLVDVAHHLEDLGALGVLGAFGRVPLRALDNDVRHTGHGLHVVDDGGFVPHPYLAGERRFDPGVAPFAFNGLDERGFLTADIGAAAGLYLNAE